MTDVPTTASRTMDSDLKDMFKPQKRHEAFATERQVEATDQSAVAVKAESHAVGHVHLVERQLPAGRCDRTCVDEEGSVESPPRLPSVLGAEQRSVVVAKTRLAKSAQVPMATERWLQIEGNRLTASRPE